GQCFFTVDSRRDFILAWAHIRPRLKPMKKTVPISRSGRFTGGAAAEVAQFTESISFDWRLWRHDLLGSLAHAAMLQKIVSLTRSESRAIIHGLDAIGRQIEAGKFRWKP